MPLLGISEDRSQLKFVMVSEWMANGNINQFVRTHWDVNRFKLVGFLYGALPSSSVIETFVTSAAGRRRERPRLPTCLGDDPWGY